MAVRIFRDYLIACENDPDVVETIKIKTGHVVDQMENTFNNIAGGATEKADELLHKAKRKAKTIVDKLSDCLKD
jgi:vacuolar-type H+-ATPase subunit H